MKYLKEFFLIYFILFIIVSFILILYVYLSSIFDFTIIKYLPKIILSILYSFFLSAYISFFIVYHVKRARVYTFISLILCLFLLQDFGKNFLISNILKYYKIPELFSFSIFTFILFTFSIISIIFQLKEILPKSKAISDTDIFL